MKIFDLIMLAFGVMALTGGLASLFTRKVYMMGGDAGRYTEESLGRYARPYGVYKSLLGIGLILGHINTPAISEGSFFTAGCAAMYACLAVAVIIAIVSGKLLVRKDAAC